MIPILLDNTKTLAELIASKTGGIGDITGAYDGVAVEEANGLKEITFKLPISSPRYSELAVGSYVKVKVDEFHVPQIYEVYKITKPMKGIVTVKAQHISYILGKATVMPFEATGITMVTTKMIQNLVGTFPFTFDSDIVNSASAFKIDKPMSFRNAIGGWKGSILDVFGGELDWDNLDVHLYAHRGRDRGVSIEYGKNLVDLTQEESNANVYDAVIGYAIKDETTYVGDIQKITTTNSPRTLNVDFSSAFDYDETPTVAKLNQLALAYAQNNRIGIPKINLRVAFEPLERFSEYEDITLLEQTGLFDTVHVTFPKLGVDATAQVIRTEYDFINEKPISIELGNAKTNLISLIDTEVEENTPDIDIEGAVNNAIGQLDSYIQEFSETMANSLGLFYTRVEKAGGGFQVYLHNRPNLADSQYQWTINAGGFAVSQDGGDTWTAGIDANGNAIFNSMSANIVRALKVYGSYIQGSEIVFGDPDTQGSKYITAKPYTSGVTFDGTGTIRMQPQEFFYVNNLASDGTHMHNQFVMNKQGSTYNSNYIELINYDDTQNYLMANFFEMDAHFNYNNAVYNRIIIRNYGTATGTRYGGNYISLNAYSNNTRLDQYNYKPASADEYANTLRFSAYDTSSAKYNSIYLNNYSYSQDLIANQFSLYTSETSSNITVQNNEFGSNKVINRVYLMASENSSMLELDNGRVDLSSTSYTQVNRLTMTSNSSGNSIGLFNLNSSGTIMNSLLMKSDATTELYSYSTITIHGAGRVDINSSGSQDLRLISADDIHLNPVGFIEVNGIYIYFSGGYVRYTTSRETASANKGY